MKNMTLKEIAAVCGGSYHGNEADLCREISGVAIDSRKAEKGCLFAAIRGVRADGHDFIPQAIQSGALCALSEKALPNAGYPYIIVPSCAQALKALAEHYRNSLDIRVVGISGSVGKTSTKEMVASVLGQDFCVHKTEGNLNNEIGLPLTVFKMRQGHQISVLEMGISHFGDMEPLARIARPDICVITNIGFAHLEHLKTREGILKEKTDMLRFMRPGGTVVLNGDDDMLASFCPPGGASPVLFGLSDKCAYRAFDISDLGLEGTKAAFHTPDFDFCAQIHVPGSHMIYNALAAIAVGRIFGMDEKSIKAGVEALRPVAGRNNLIATEYLSIIDDCYNANPASMKASLDVLAKAPGRKIAVLGDMFELGEGEKEMHEDVGRYAALLPVDVLVCIGGLSKYMIKGAERIAGPSGLYWFATKNDFFAEMDSILHRGDTVLVKASHAMGFSEIVEKLHLGPS